MRNKLTENGSFCGLDLCDLVEIVFIYIDPYSHPIKRKEQKIACKHPQTL